MPSDLIRAGIIGGLTWVGFNYITQNPINLPIVGVVAMDLALAFLSAFAAYIILKL